MNQNIQLDLAGVMPAVRATGLLRSLCTIQVPPTSEEFGESGAMDPATPWTDLTDHVDIPCMDAPIQTGDAVSLAKVKAMSEILEKATRHVLLDGYYPLIQQNYRAIVDGLTYEIFEAEADSQRIMTRLALQINSI